MNINNESKDDELKHENPKPEVVVKLFTFELTALTIVPF